MNIERILAAVIAITAWLLGLIIGRWATCDKAKNETDAIKLDRVTVEDALTAMGSIQFPQSRVVVATFLTRLVKMTAHEAIINTDEEGFILEGAYQSGFDNIDDDANLFVVHGNDLIKYVLVNREIAARLALEKAKAEPTWAVHLDVMESVRTQLSVPGPQRKELYHLLTLLHTDRPRYEIEAKEAAERLKPFIMGEEYSADLDALRAQVKQDLGQKP